MIEAKALIIDDEPDILELLTITLSRMGIQTVSAKSVTEAVSLLNSDSFDFCLTDLKLPDGEGTDIVDYIQDQGLDTPIAVITAHGDMDTAVYALKIGAFDFVSKPLHLQKLRDLVHTALKLKGFNPEKSKSHNDLLLGESSQISQLRNTINKLAKSQAPVFISGASGTGKELVAKLIHQNGPRNQGPFVPVNCGAIPSELMESEFFGHKKGSFTGAISNKAGLFKVADGGTLFLDEVADLPLAMQVKLLRSIQERSIRPIGEEKEQPVNVRILSATHKDLNHLVDQGLFRQDLFYRINVIEVKVPCLRERTGDIRILANHILTKISEEWDQEPPKLSIDAQRALDRYDFPGNVRELENILERAMTLCEGDTIQEDDLRLSNKRAQPTQPVADPNLLPDDFDIPTPASAPNTTDAAGPLNNYLDDLEKSAIVTALERNRWNKTATAKELGLTLRALRYRLKKLGID